ncbi:ATP-binding protein [Streptomyces zhihengii]
MELVERAEQAMHLKHLLAQSGARKGKVVLLDGPSGSGKTELLRQVADHAADTGCLVLRAACSRAESALPLGVLGQLLRSAPIAGERAAELDLLLRRAGRSPPPAPPVTSAHPARRHPSAPGSPGCSTT